MDDSVAIVCVTAWRYNVEVSSMNGYGRKKKRFGSYKNHMYMICIKLTELFMITYEVAR